LKKGTIVSTNPTTKPATINYFRVPRPLWRRIKPLLPKPPRKRGKGRPPADARAVFNGIWYILWTGCQWKAVHRTWFGVSSSTLHAYFQAWQQQGLFTRLFQIALRFYARRRRIRWQWQSVDSRSCAAPLGGQATGKNPTDRAKRGSKVHILVDERGAPLAVYVTGANRHDKWGAASLVVSIMAKRPGWQQHFCADRAYDFADVHAVVETAGYRPHIKHRRLRNEPVAEATGGPGERSHPARRWVVERTLSWLAKRRSLKLRWSKKAQNWLALVQFACAHILCDLAFYG
jgi:putative transposase